MTEKGDYTVITSEDAPRRSNIWWIILVVILVIVCCCCAGILIFYYWIGDIILQIFNDIAYQLGTSTY
jgi:flagellar basal body-associated protein FliL